MGTHCHLPVPPLPGCGFSQRQSPLGLPQAQRKVAGCSQGRGDPGAWLSVRCGRTMGPRPHPGPSCSPSCLRLSLSYLTHLAVRGFAAEEGDLRGRRATRPGRRRAAAAPWGLPGSGSSREGRGGSRAVSVQPAPLASCRQNPERGSDAREKRGWRLRACGTQRNADAAGFSCREGGVSSPSRSVRD